LGGPVCLSSLSGLSVAVEGSRWRVHLAGVGNARRWLKAVVRGGPTARSDRESSRSTCTSSRTTTRSRPTRRFREWACRQRCKPSVSLPEPARSCVLRSGSATTGPALPVRWSRVRPASRAHTASIFWIVCPETPRFSCDVGLRHAVVDDGRSTASSCAHCVGSRGLTADRPGPARPLFVRAPAYETVKRLDLAGHAGLGYYASRRAWADGPTHQCPIEQSYLAAAPSADYHATDRQPRLCRGRGPGRWAGLGSISVDQALPVNPPQHSAAGGIAAECCLFDI
jgi:hypothetical protein